MQAYQTQLSVLPPGTLRGSQANVSSSGTAGPGGIYRRQTFVVALWPYLDLTRLAVGYNFDYSFYATINQSSVMSQEPVYFCPSDRTALWTADPYTRSRGNYVVSWGNGSYWQTESNYQPSPFGPNRFTDPASITDGLSTTMLMSEVLQPLHDSDFDFRADIINDDLACAVFLHVQHAQRRHRFDGVRQRHPAEPLPAGRHDLHVSPQQPYGRRERIAGRRRGAFHR